MSDETHVYIIAHIKNNKPRAPVKVGISADPAGRLRTLQTANHSSLVLLASFRCPTRVLAKAMETAFHTVRAGFRLEGEWFDMPPVRAVEDMCTNFRLGLARYFGGEPEVVKAALEATGVLDNEFHLSKWKAHTESHSNDNASGVAL